MSPIGATSHILGRIRLPLQPFQNFHALASAGALRLTGHDKLNG
jgi:hypothetical protein